MRYDVVRDYDWTSSPRGSGLRNSAPKAIVKSYKINANQIMLAFRGYMNIYDTQDKSADEFYDRMYSESVTEEDDFNFPMFSDRIRGFSNAFGDSFAGPSSASSGGIGSEVNEMVKQLFGGLGELKNITGADKGMDTFKKNAENAGAIGGWAGVKDFFNNQFATNMSPGTYIETPMYYQYDKTDGPIEVTFVLSNTINADSLQKNRELIDKLTRINRPLRKNSLTVEPPRIYKIRIPGHRFIRWAYCSDFAVDFIGTRREINGVIEPEAYLVSMTFQSLTIEHAGFMDHV
jgi:hypothetical protein